MDYLEIMANVLELEAQSLKKAQGHLSVELGEKLANLFISLRAEKGRLVVSGVGKSGIIAKKIAATFQSLGLGSYFLHPTEALHGDLGLVEKGDALILISKSGNTEELLKLLPFLDIPEEKRIGLLGSVDSKLGEQCGIVLDCSVEAEACINNLAPTTSTTLALAMGDALSVLYENIVGLSKEDFAENHPAGLGRALRLKVKDVMWKATDCPFVGPGATLQEIIIEMTKIPLGGLAVLDQGQFVGIIV